ncbi:hypothetical protein EV714DRAFT_269248 [Schizophyllum commune]
MALARSSSLYYHRYEDGANFLPTWWYDEPQNQALPRPNEPLAQPIYPEMVVPDTLQASLNTPSWPWPHDDALPPGISTSLAETQMPPPPAPVAAGAADFCATTVPQPQTCPTVAPTFPDLSILATFSEPWNAAAPPLAITPWNADGHDASRREVGSQAQTEASSKRRAGPSRDPSFWCGRCFKTFTRRKNLTDHMLRHQNRKEYTCLLSDCVSRFNTRSDLERHIRVVHKRNPRRYLENDVYESLAHHPQKDLYTRPTTALKTEDMAFTDSGGTPWPLHRAHSQ